MLIRAKNRPLTSSLRHGAGTDPLRTPFGRSSVEGRRKAVGRPKRGRTGSVGALQSLGDEVDDGVLLVEAYVAQRHMLQQRACLFGAAQRQQYAVAVELLYELAAGTALGHTHSLTHHEVDAGTSVETEVYIAVDNLVDGEVDAHRGGLEQDIDVVVDTHGVRPAVRERQGATGLLLKHLADLSESKS